MQYVIFLEDVADGADLRQQYLNQHLEFVETNLDRILVAGPRKNADGGMIGSLYIVSADGAEDARRFLERDPYYAAGLWQHPIISAFNGVAGEWVGGRNW